jgi:geranylgeranyl reductase family protein
MPTRFDADVIVAGAGPAGAAAAIHLRRAGLHVVLLDWQRFPRDKVCGDFLSAVALSELHALGVKASVLSQAAVIRQAGVWLDGRHLLTSPLPRSRALPMFGRAVPRRVLDHLLVAKARADGVHLAEQHRLVAYRATPRHVDVDVQAHGRPMVMRAPVLIGADGSTSVVARQLRGEPAPDRDRVIAVRAYFDGVNGPADRADLYFSTATFPGYAWLFPTGPSTANVGVGMVLKTLPKSSEHLPALLHECVRSDSAIGDRLRGATMTHKIVGWPLTTYNAALPLVGDRVALVGDAAGLINPLNGEGIQYALLSGRWVAESLVAGLARATRGRPALSAYAARVDGELRADLSLSRLVVDLIRNRALNAIWLEALETIVARAAVDPEYAAIAGGVLAGVVPTRRVLDLDIVRKTLAQGVRRLGTGAVGQAVRRPSSVLALAVTMTQAALAAARPMLDHRADTELWAVGLGRAALAATAAAVGRRAAGVPRARRAGAAATTRREGEAWRDEARRPVTRARPQAAAARPQTPHVNDALGASSGSPHSVRRARKS